MRLDRCFLILFRFLAALLSDSKDNLEVPEVADLESDGSFFQMIVRFHDDFFRFRINISSELPSTVAKKGSGISIDLGTPSIKFEPNISESIIAELNICESIVILELKI